MPSVFRVLCSWSIAAALTAPALAEAKRVDPYFVVVTRPKESVRCADGPIYYPVGEVKAGDVLRVDGESPGWLRVEYLPGMKAYVPAAEGTFDQSARTVRLTKGSVLRAANATGQLPWWPLLDNASEMPAGTSFADAQPVKTPDGNVDGYLVAAPPKARGFIRTDATRKATADEAATYTGATAPAAAPKTAPTPPPAAPAPAGTPTASTPPSSGTPAPGATPPADGATLVKVPETVPPPIPATGNPADAPGAQGAAAAPAPAPARPGQRPEVTRRIDDVNTLRTMYERVMSSAQDEAELQTVITEFNRKIEALGSAGDDARVRAGLQQRADALRLRQEVIETRRRIRDTGALDDRMRQVRVALEDVEKQAIYTVVGRILPSTVYDGQRGMPLMYRVETADASSTRTVGYVVPREGIDLLTKLGKVVGIVGESRFDPALNLNIVAPTRVDEFRLSGGRLEVVPPEGSSGVTPATPSGQPLQPAGQNPQPASPPAGQQPQPGSGVPVDMNK
jgi:hypothetical protein